ncbi:TetR/AcrR family transcriptional regulator [Billgrantia tianxiuensis]|jgi:AcrR family transcriptional regulator|uniref:TetR/AcrR family transcriptional regulator n=1 Tax=Billgrantia tianxiuensis TaxID=2497861 RepID=A0A6I6SKC9_9GAMM|nr:MULTISPECIES: TetR/AcrR family transcriptional regulator [Halomonas]MCE8033325.1 TetR/AcrR family transcriptional regulator [Halomonas sp. MCCC 1A11057]QHC49056.1 TetR/AcrR family transcriptional regulator [Halomonas tianxiuensis]
MSQRGRPRGFDREEALRRAMEVFWAQGYDNASIADLTRAMGINAPSLYATFGSKEALFHEAVKLYVRTEGSGIWEQVETAPTAHAAIAHVLHATAEAFTRGDTPRGCMIVLAAPQMQGANTQVCDALKAHRQANGCLLERRLKRAVEEGELPASTDCRALASYFVTVQHGMSIQARDGASRETLLAIADCAMASWSALTS